MVNLLRRIVFFPKSIRVSFVTCSSVDQEIYMADTGIIDMDTGVVVEKRGRGHPRGSKNKPKEVSMAILSSSAPAKRCPSRPLGSKNKPKASFSLAKQHLDASSARQNAPPPPVNIFSFFRFRWCSMPRTATCV
jgi:hypothetical protein